MILLERLLDETERSAHELAEALRAHADEGEVRALHARLEDHERRLKEETKRVELHPAEA